MGALRDQGLLDDTLVVSPPTTPRRPAGASTDGSTRSPGANINACDPTTPTSASALRSDCNWYYGRRTPSDEAYLDPSPAIRQLRDALTLAGRRRPTCASPTRTPTSRLG